MKKLHPKYPKNSSYKKNKILALIIIFVLFSQLLIDRADEPYPAILLPGGRKTLTNSKEFIVSFPEYRFVVHTNSKDSIYIDKLHLFNTLPASYMAVSYRSIPKLFNINSIDSDGALSGEAKSWLNNRLALNNFHDVSYLEIEGYFKMIFVNNGKIDSVTEELIFDSFNIDL